MWKNIPGFKGYQVSGNGSVRTFFKETKDKRMLKNKVLKQRGNYSIGARVDLPIICGMHLISVLSQHVRLHLRVKG